MHTGNFRSSLKRRENYTYNAAQLFAEKNKRKRDIFIKSMEDAVEWEQGEKKNRKNYVLIL